MGEAVTRLDENCPHTSPRCEVARLNNKLRLTCLKCREDARFLLNVARRLEKEHHHAINVRLSTGAVVELRLPASAPLGGFFSF